MTFYCTFDERALLFINFYLSRFQEGIFLLWRSSRKWARGANYFSGVFFVQNDPSVRSKTIAVDQRLVSAANGIRPDSRRCNSCFLSAFLLRVDLRVELPFAGIQQEAELLGKIPSQAFFKIADTDVVKDWIRGEDRLFVSSALLCLCYGAAACEKWHCCA